MYSSDKYTLFVSLFLLLLVAFSSSQSRQPTDSLILGSSLSLVSKISVDTYGTLNSNLGVQTTYKDLPINSVVSFPYISRAVNPICKFNTTIKMSSMLAEYTRRNTTSGKNFKTNYLFYYDIDKVSNAAYPIEVSKYYDGTIQSYESFADKRTVFYWTYTCGNATLFEDPSFDMLKCSKTVGSGATATTTYYQKYVTMFQSLPQAPFLKEILNAQKKPNWLDYNLSLVKGISSSYYSRDLTRNYNLYVQLARGNNSKRPPYTTDNVLLIYFNSQVYPVNLGKKYSVRAVAAGAHDTHYIYLLTVDSSSRIRVMGLNLDNVISYNPLPYPNETANIRYDVTFEAAEYKNVKPHLVFDYKNKRVYFLATSNIATDAGQSVIVYLDAYNLSYIFRVRSPLSNYHCLHTNSGTSP